ncbi:hypothetical protein ACUNP7_005229, partial [Escherichia coli]
MESEIFSKDVQYQSLHNKKMNLCLSEHEISILMGKKGRYSSEVTAPRQSGEASHFLSRNCLYYGCTLASMDKDDKSRCLHSSIPFCRMLSAALILQSC